MGKIRVLESSTVMSSIAQYGADVRLNLSGKGRPVPADLDVPQASYPKFAVSSA